MDTFLYVLNNSRTGGKFSIDFWGEIWAYAGICLPSSEHTLNHEYEVSEGENGWGVDCLLDATFRIIFSSGEKIRFCAGIGYKGETPVIGIISHGLNIRAGIKF